MYTYATRIQKKLNITASATVRMGLEEHQFLFNNIHEVQQLGPQPTIESESAHSPRLTLRGVLLA